MHNKESIVVLTDNFFEEKNIEYKKFIIILYI